jgi:hypothetical protein
VAWTYSDYITYADAAAKLTRLRLHIHEVTDKIGREQSAGDMSTSSTALQKYLQDLKNEERSLSGATSDSSDPTLNRPARHVFGGYS